MNEPHRVCRVGATLGEGPTWIGDALWFVDIKQRHVHRFDPSRQVLTTWPAPAQVGWIAPVAGGGLLVGLQTGLHRFDPETGSFELVIETEPALPGNRLNDATVDAKGRLWFGSMDDGEAAPSGHVYRADNRGIARVTGGISITNGPAVSPDGRTLYHHDTLGGLVFASDLGADGEVASTRVLARIPSADGYPDGPTVDAEGCLWVALFAGWSVRRYAPDGTLLRSIRFPVANITKIAFGGADRRTAYATTAAKGLSEAERKQQPFAGDLFAFDAGVAGQPAYAVAPFAARRLYD